MTSAVYIDIESPDQAALLNISEGHYEITKKPVGRLCSGYGYFKNIQGEKKLVALVTINGCLYLYFDQFYELGSDDTEAKLKSGFFKNEFSLYK